MKGTVAGARLQRPLFDLPAIYLRVSIDWRKYRAVCSEGATRWKEPLKKIQVI